MKKTSRPETSFELLKVRQRTPLRGVSRNARLSEEKANHQETSDRQCFSSGRTCSLREESQEVAELLREGGAVEELLAVRRSKTVAGEAQIALPRRAETTIARVNEVLTTFSERDRDGEVLTAVRRFPARAAEWSDWPAWVQTELRAAYQSKGIARPYSHQALAAEAVHAEKNVAIVTPTASGKTLCYNLPVINAILENEDK